jgi:1-acyl-sn-glycerol-3-phosphate acyltransferase
MTNSEAHELARVKGVSRPLYALVRLVVVPFMAIYFRLRISGAANIPPEGAAIVTPNHKSFYDSFFIAAATRRHLRFMGKSELFEGRKGRILIRLGAFPVRRGSADAEALETARVILGQGGLLSLFPEGTRVRDPDALGEPKRGAARLALESGAPLVPAAITGTEKLFIGPLPRPRRVQIAFSEPIPVDELEATPEVARQLTDDQLWPQVEEEFSGLISRPGLIAAGLAAAGIGVGIAARRRGAGGKRRGKKKGRRR